VIIKDTDSNVSPQEGVEKSRDTLGSMNRNPSRTNLNAQSNSAAMAFKQGKISTPAKIDGTSG